MNKIFVKDLGRVEYQVAWDLQEQLLLAAVTAKREVAARVAEEKERGVFAQEASAMQEAPGAPAGVSGAARVEQAGNQQTMGAPQTTGEPATARQNEQATHEVISNNWKQAPALPKHHLLFCEHPPVYTLGKSGHESNLLISDEQLAEGHIQYVKTNRGGDITFHGPGQLVGYPILDLEQFFTDIGKYLRFLEEVTIRTLADYGIKGERSPGETGVWLDAGTPNARKICAMGVRCSRWVTMHGFALNVNTDMRYFANIIPCGIADKAVTSVAQELGREVPMTEIKEKMMKYFGEVFSAEMVVEA